MHDGLVNKVAASGLITLKPEEWAPLTLVAPFDLKDFLFHGLILKEKDFRESLAHHDWAQYDGMVLCIHCTADAIIPSWAYMLVTTMASGKTSEIFFGPPSAWVTSKILDHIRTMNIDQYADQRVIIKGCSDAYSIGPEIYVALTERLVPVVKSLMFGEPCSTVPVYKRPKSDA